LEIFRLTGLTPTQRALTEEARALRSYQSHLSFTGFLIDPADALHTRIAQRLESMQAQGLLDEVRSLAPRLGLTAREAVGYRQLIDVVAGEVEEQEGWRRTAAATADLARKQRTFFRRDPRLASIPWEPDPERRYRALSEAMEVACAS
jgi:tRNA dimethylallyltransferase